MAPQVTRTSATAAGLLFVGAFYYYYSGHSRFSAERANCECREIKSDKANLGYFFISCSLRPIKNIILDSVPSYLTARFIQKFLYKYYLFYYNLFNICIKILNKTNGQTRSSKVKNDTFNGTEGVLSKFF
jgi:hypothetical protein